MPTSYRSSLSRIGLVWNNLFYPPRDYFVWVLKSFSNWIKLTVTGSHLKLFTLRLQLENKFDFRAKYSKDFFISISNTLSEGFCWTWGFTRYHPLYTISFQKIEQIAIEWCVFGGILGDLWGWQPRLFCKPSDFLNLSVFSNFDLYSLLLGL